MRTIQQARELREAIKAVRKQPHNRQLLNLIKAARKFETSSDYDLINIVAEAIEEEKNGK